MVLLDCWLTFGSVTLSMVVPKVVPVFFVLPPQTTPPAVLEGARVQRTSAPKRANLSRSSAAVARRWKVLYLRDELTVFASDTF